MRIRYRPTVRRNLADVSGMSLFLSGVNTSRYLTRSKQQLLTSADSRRARKVHAIEVHEQEARQGIKGSAIATMGPSHCENSATLPLMNRNRQHGYVEGANLIIERR